jgi:hypothetical protein
MNYKVNFYLFLHLSKQPAVGARSRSTRKRALEEQSADDDSKKPSTPPAKMKKKEAPDAQHLPVSRY